MRNLPTWAPLSIITVAVLLSPVLAFLTAIAIKNAKTGLSRTATVMMDNGAHVGRFRIVSQPTCIDLG